MKKLKLITAVLIAVLSSASVITCFSDVNQSVTASEIVYYDDTVVYNDMYFNIREDRNNELILKVCGNTTETNLVIPEKIGEYTVTGIDNSAFSDNKGKGFIVENVTLPDSIDYFGYNVFRNSTVISVNIPKSLRMIPSYTFERCRNLETVIFHDNILAIADSAFKNTNITVPQNLQKRVSDDSILLHESSMSQYKIKDDDFTYLIATDDETQSLYCSITDYIGENSEIIIPEKFTDVPLISVDFKDADKSAITSVTFPETTRNISVNSNALSNSLISELTINSPCSLASSSFENCKELKTAAFRDDVKISGRAFNNCTNLISVEFGGKADLNYYSFLNCQSIENIILDTSQPIVGNAFNGCVSLMNINSEPVFDSSTGDFKPEYSDFIKNSFYMSEEIGFLNEYTKAQYKKIADEVTTAEMNDTEKVKALHDWLCQNTRYADSTIPAEYHTDASVLLNDSTVCEGYAKALNLLCNSAGIETYYIHSSDHAWNIVKIGGQYFHIDSTWDDGDDISYSWFLKSDSEMTDSHGSWSAYIPTSLHNFQKDGTPECKYQIGDVNKDGEISVADLVKMNRWLLGAETEYTDNIILYDINVDGDADVFDIIFMRQKLTS